MYKKKRRKWTKEMLCCTRLTAYVAQKVMTYKKNNIVQEKCCVVQDRLNKLHTTSSGNVVRALKGLTFQKLERNKLALEHGMTLRLL